MKIPILTYQPMHIDGNDYRANDLRALASDLRQITEAGFRIVPLRTATDAWLDARELGGKLVALASNAGTDFDSRDLAHPKAEMHRSAINPLPHLAAPHPCRPQDLHSTSLV